MHTSLSHRRTHNLLLISKLLSQQSHTSPFTLVLDTLEQPSTRLLREYLRRAKSAKGLVTIFLAFETFVKPANVDYFVPCHDVGEGLGWERISRDVGETVRKSGGKSKHFIPSICAGTELRDFPEFLVVIDSLTTLACLSMDTASKLNLTTFLSTLLQPSSTQLKRHEQDPPPAVSLVAVYHTDVPLSTSRDAYSPTPQSLLSYLATTLITVHCLAILLAENSAHAKSLAAPSFGLSGDAEGQIVGLKPTQFTRLKSEERGLVLELEHRRKSGRGVREWFFLPESPIVSKSGVQGFRETVTLLDDHPLFRRPTEEGEDPEQELSGMTFELGLTERQRLEREGVVLPYFDAQKAGGGGEGGRILYDMGIEDDFDEEEDEI